LPVQYWCSVVICKPWLCEHDELYADQLHLPASNGS
jgi:hypothetical protein